MFGRCHFTVDVWVVLYLSCEYADFFFIKLWRIYFWLKTETHSTVSNRRWQELNKFINSVNSAKCLHISKYTSNVSQTCIHIVNTRHIHELSSMTVPQVMYELNIEAHTRHGTMNTNVVLSGWWTRAAQPTQTESQHNK